MMPPPLAEALPAIYFDYSDLIAYFRHNRFPTGIQRVQIEIFKAAVEWDAPIAIRGCAYMPDAGFWVDIDAVAFRLLCELASTPGSHVDAEWQGAFNDFLARMAGRPATVFPVGSALVNLGSSWWMADYMRLIRQAKARYGIRYVPLIYDLIPIITPEYCGTDLVSAFSHWISSVFCHADLLAAISRCTQQDVIRAAEAVKPLTHEPIIMPLDAEFGGGEGTPTVTERLLTLDGLGLRAGGYVLVVGTLEVRKNQMLIFQAWARLIERHGSADTPTLVCVGKMGHGFEAMDNFLRAHVDLRDKVVMLSGLSDVELNTLYADCLFTVFASTYEGWGLPVTESLCHGKVCLSADHSSLPEAGGRFAEFFEAGSVNSLLAHAEKLLFHPDYRAGRERQIVAEFRPRSWQAVLQGLVAGLRAHVTSLAEPAPLAAPLALGTIYGLSQDPQTRRPDRATAVAEMLLNDDSWYPIEPWGAWARQRRATLSFRMPDLGASADGVLVCLKVRAPRDGLTLSVTIAGVSGRFSVAPGRSSDVRLVVPFPDASDSARGAEPTIIQLLVDKLVPPGDGDNRPLGIGLEALTLCRTGDALTRLAIVERGIMMLSASPALA